MVLSQASWLGYLEQLSALLAQVGLAKAQLPLLEYLDTLGDLVQQIGYTTMFSTGIGAYAAYRVFCALCLSPLRNVPGPLFGRLTSLRANVFVFMGARARKAREDYDKYGDIYVYKPDAVSISNPEHIRAVLSTHQFRKANIYSELRLLQADTSGSAVDPKVASTKRRQIGPYFSNTYLARMENDILEHGYLALRAKWNGLLEKSDSGEAKINYHQHFLHASYDTIGKLTFGKGFDALKNDDSTVQTWISQTLTYLALKSTSFFKAYPFSLMIASLERAHSDFINHGAKCIAERRQLLAGLEASGETDKIPSDLLQGFISAQDAESKAKMSPVEVHAEVLVMLIAGTETSSNTLMWTLYLFMIYPQCYRKAVEEARSAFAKDHVITYSEAKATLPYLEACFYESLRLCSVSGGQLPRIAPKEGAVFDGHLIPGGTEININIHGAHYNRKYWKDPYLYDPTRFLDNEDAKRNIFTFSYGVRVCPGRQLAWIEMLTTMANMLKDYDLRLPDETTHFGPNVLDHRGYPKILDAVSFLSVVPANTERDCVIVISKHK